MTSQYTEARKRVEEAIARYATPGVASSGVVCCPDDLRLIIALSAPPVTVEEVSSSRDHALSAAFAREGEIVGPWRIWFDPPPIGTRECDWHYQHDDAEPECPSWMHGHCASREACIAEIINTYEERLS